MLTAEEGQHMPTGIELAVMGSFNGAILFLIFLRSRMIGKN